jgi:hypothetical protein
MLSNDICRCHDAGCPERERCARWIARTDDHREIERAASLFPFDINITDPCPYRIDPGPSEAA